MDIKYSSQYEINDIVIISKTGNIDVRKLMNELNIYDNILLPFMSGNILISDSIGLLDKMSFDGSEFIRLNISKDDDDIAIDKTFRIYTITDRVAVNSTNESYVLHFCSEEQFFALQKKISQTYTDTYSNIAYKILTDHLKVKEKKIGIFEDSYGIASYNVNNINPIEGVQTCAKRSMNIDNIPNFLFFENKWGINFVSMSTLFQMQKNTPIKLNMEIKNAGEDPIKKLYGVLMSKVITQGNTLKKIMEGRDASKMIGFDFLTNKFEEEDVSIFGKDGLMDKADALMNDSFSLNALTNRDDLTSQFEFNSKRIFNIVNSLSDSSKYVKKNSQKTIHYDKKEEYILQRSAVFSNFFDKRIQLHVPGNFQFTSGVLVELEYPEKSIRIDGETDIEDKTNSGNFIVSGTRHRITFSKHDTFLEIITDSSKKENIFFENNAQRYSVEEA